MWFDQLTGFAENPTDVARYLQLDGTTLYSHANGRTFACGHFAAVSLASLQQQISEQQMSQPHSASQNKANSKRLTLREWVGDVQRLHADSRSAGALFQVASQFNALEMPSPDISPDHGISDYQYDRTQGPACAIACGAGTLYRQYFLPFGQSPAAGDTTNTAADPVSSSTLTSSQVSSSHFPSSHWPTSQATAPLAANTLRGQTRHRQLDMAAPLHQALQHALGCGPLWRMQNGYLLADEPALRAINHYLQHASEPCKTELRKLLQIGMQWHTEVTLKPQAAPDFMKGESAHAVQISVQHSDQNSAPAQTKTQTQTQAGHLVSQAYCSALPVAYNDQSADLWQPFAQLVLDAAYEATLAAAVINAQQTGNNTVFLTQLGGGAFGNRSDWIFNAIERALRLYQHYDLDVVMVSYGRASWEVARLIEKLGNSNTSC